MWIEIALIIDVQLDDAVTPLAGVWIEIARVQSPSRPCGVTPLAGVWIEIRKILIIFTIRTGHSPRGSVD